MSAIGCLSGRAWRVGGILSAECGRAGGAGGIAAATAVKVSGIKSAACSLVCSLDGTVYLRVRPEDVQWITMEMGIDYDVISNTNWNVE